MKVGTKSLLFGVHQVLLHPIFVLLAWRKLYHEWPTWKELICIVIHDWGYWGSPNMDGSEGEEHARRSAEFALWHIPGMDTDEYRLIYCHSRHMARRIASLPSKLCWADKLAAAIEPMWLYLLRASLSGEIHEYRQMAIDGGYLPSTVTKRDWFCWYREKVRVLAKEQRGDAVPYVNPQRADP